ncbi:MAG: TrbC/VirB2 family protein [Thermoprotei archaeon]
MRKIILGMLTTLGFIPTVYAQTGTTTITFPQPTPQAPPVVQTVVQNALNLIWWLAIAAIVGMIIWSGITMLTSEDPRDQAAARARLIRVIIGAVIIIGGLQIIKWLLGIA